MFKWKNFSFWSSDEKQKRLYALFNAIDANLKYQNNIDKVAAVAAADVYKRGFLEGILLDDLELIKTNRLELLNNDVNWYGKVWGSFQESLQAVGCGYWAKLYADLFANRFVVDKEALKRRLNVPKEIKAQGTAAVAGFLENLETQGIKRLNEARIIVIGDKGAGKTSLKTKLVDINKELPKEYESTEGVDIDVWKLEKNIVDEGVNVHIWDFAGHVITHAVHRFFLSERCIYIIVYDGRVNDRNINDSMEYWLDHVKNYGAGSPVYVIVNKKDEHTRYR
ncbi:MAG: hypothetical protein LBC12_01060 [Nitrososphaerota archaeon]|jgi:small GTP-binding protein|nr:hypothetical protein [Nitrososphaerota archaeon]